MPVLLQSLVTPGKRHRDFTLVGIVSQKRAASQLLLQAKRRSSVAKGLLILGLVGIPIKRRADVRIDLHEPFRLLLKEQLLHRVRGCSTPALIEVSKGQTRLFSQRRDSLIESLGSVDIRFGRRLTANH